MSTLLGSKLILPRRLNGTVWTPDRQITVPAGDNAQRILSILNGRVPHFTYGMPGDPVTTTEQVVTSAAQFNQYSNNGAGGVRIIVNSSFSGDVTIGRDDLDVVMSNAATINGRVTLGGASYINRLRWTGGNIGTIVGIRHRDVLFDDVYALATPSTALDPLSPEHNMSSGWDGSGNPSFERLAIINSTFELQGDPAAPLNRWAWALHTGRSYPHQGLILANSKFISNHQTVRLQYVRGLMIAGCAFNPTNTAANGLRIHWRSEDVWMADSYWMNFAKLDAINTEDVGAQVLNAVFERNRHYDDLSAFAFQSVAGGLAPNTGIVRNHTFHFTGGSGAFPSPTPLTDGGGNQMVAWNGTTIPDHSAIGAVR